MNERTYVLEPIGCLPDRDYHELERAFDAAKDGWPEYLVGTKVCLSCGARQSLDGSLPCGH